jgi:hypothetical protein
VSAAPWEALATRGFDDSRLFSAYLHTMRWNCVTATRPGLFQSPYRAGIQVKAYQLEPLRKALQFPRVNLFIADDVGLGKTIEAGLILREMLIRQKVRRTVICCPPSVVRQWKDEMEQRFGLTFVVYDRDFVAQKRRERGYSVNPWTTHNRFIISHALVRDEAYTSSLRDWLGDFCAGALLILDEAHNVAPASGSAYAVDSRLTRTIRDVAPRFEHRLFLSATPHNGHSNSFAALLEILDPHRFCRGVPVSGRLRDAVMVRRLKKDLRGLDDDFPIRRVQPVTIDGLPLDAPELVVSRLLQEYRKAKESRLSAESQSRRNAATLVVTSLQKRLLSSIEAFYRTLKVHRDHMSSSKSRGEIRNPRLLIESPDMDDERADLSEDEVAAEADVQMAAATSQTGGSPRELELLDQMLAIAQGARFEADSRMRWLAGWIKENMCPDLGQPGARWNTRRVLVFTDYTDTKRYLVEQLESLIRDSDCASQRIATFHGGISEENRELVKRAFNADPKENPLRILVATDAAREGVNLQNHCADLFHFDVPWNPSKMEQRNGRIDRKLQRAPEVWCRYFIVKQRAEDRVLDVLVKKSATIQDELGSLPSVVEKRVENLLKRGIRDDGVEQLVLDLGEIDKSEPDGPGLDTIREELEEGRERDQKLVTQIEELQQQLKASRDWIGLDEQQFREAITASLEMSGAEGLRVVDGERWEIPALHKRLGADATWAATLDSLRAPPKKGQKLWEWRKEAPIRPVVFQDPGTLDEQVVHLHLEHRLVKRLLSRFMSQGFLHNELSRGCVLLTNDPLPRVMLLGRLSLYGRDASRLHDEIVSVAADWHAPEARKHLEPLSDAGRTEVWTLFDAALRDPRLRQVSDTVRRRLQAAGPRDVADLVAALELRATEAGKEAEAALADRGEKEARQLRGLIERQRVRIQEHRNQVAEKMPQGVFDFYVKDELRQLEADRRHWDARLRDIENELVTEPARLRAHYQVKARRIEPVGLVYLWPISG